jgi:hypothetical protein
LKNVLRGDDVEVENVDNSNDDQLRFATQLTQESLRSHHEWENRQRFRHETGGYQNVYEQGGSSRASVSGGGRPIDLSFTLRSTNIDLVRNKTMKHSKVNKGMLNTLRK